MSSGEKTYLLSVVSLCLVVGGWYLAIWLGSRLANRNEARSLCDRIINYIHDLHMYACQVWDEGKVDEDKADQNISAKLTIIEVLSDVLSKRTGRYFFTNEQALNMRNSFTEGYKTYLVTSDDAEKCHRSFEAKFNIDEECFDAIEKIERAYLEEFIPKSRVSILMHNYPVLSAFVFSSLLLAFVYFVGNYIDCVSKAINYGI